MHILSGGLLDLLCKLTDLRALLLVSRSHFHREQMPQSVHRYVHLAAFAALVAIVAGPASAFRRGLQGASVHDGRCACW